MSTKHDTQATIARLWGQSAIHNRAKRNSVEPQSREERLWLVNIKPDLIGL